MMPSRKSPSALADTDLCVMCGMCLPHCPTYQLYQSENESPRGRIALIQSIDQGRIDASSIGMQHIDHCLGCLNCQTICPSRVPYGEIIDEFRDQYRQHIDKPLLSRQILKQSQQTGRIDKLMRFASTPVVRQLINAGGRILGVPNIPATKAARLETDYPVDNALGQVTLFTGCTANSMDSQTIKDTIKLLNILSYNVVIPQNQSCCGSLLQHNGEKKAARLLRKKQQAFILNSHDSEAILFFSPACGHSLKPLAKTSIRDAREFLWEKLETNSLPFKSFNKTVALHESCSHRNMLKGGDINTRLLELIPDLKIQYSKQPALCCGAAGIQSINYPQQAHALGTQKVQSFDLPTAELLLSDNIGCSMHIKSLLNEYNLAIDVLHPISLLRQQLKST